MMHEATTVHYLFSPDVDACGAKMASRLLIQSLKKGVFVDNAAAAHVDHHRPFWQQAQLALPQQIGCGSRAREADH